MDSSGDAKTPWGSAKDHGIVCNTGSAENYDIRFLVMWEVDDSRLAGEKGVEAGDEVAPIAICHDSAAYVTAASLGTARTSASANMEV